MSAVFSLTSYLTGSAAGLTGYPGTLFAYFNPTSTSNAQYVFAFVNSGAATSNAFKLRAAGDSGTTVRNTVGNGTSTSAVSTSTTWSQATWQRMYHTMTSSTARSVYLNNGGVGNDVTDLTPTGIDTSVIAANSVLGVQSGNFVGSLAHLAGWNVVLDATQRSMLEARIHPFFVARNNLIFCVDCWDADSAFRDLVGTITWTATGSPTFSTNPGIRIPQYHL